MQHIAHKEIEIAAKWWANVIRKGARQDNGDGFQSIALSVLQSRANPPTEEQLQAFEQALINALEADIDPQSWFPDDPRRGSALRSIGVDYGPAGVLRDAMDAVGLAYILLPCKTLMWINPGSVEVSYGYGADVVQIGP